jgi:hypothetical protein
LLTGFLWLRLRHAAAESFRKAFQVCDGGLSRLGMSPETVRSETLIPNLSSSPWIRGAPQSGLASAIFRIRWLTSGLLTGRLSRLRLEIQVQKRRHPCRCQLRTVSCRADVFPHCRTHKVVFLVSSRRCVLPGSVMLRLRRLSTLIDFRFAANLARCRSGKVGWGSLKGRSRAWHGTRGQGHRGKRPAHSPAAAGLAQAS